MEVLAISAAVVVALLTAVLLVFAVFSVYLVIVHRPAMRAHNYTTAKGSFVSAVWGSVCL